MELSCRSQHRIMAVLNGWLPPLLRDSRTLMRLPMRLAFGRQAALVMDFKDRVYEMSDEEVAAVYRTLRSHASHETSLSDGPRERILVDAVGSSVLDVGCGAGELASKMSRSMTVTGCDIVVSAEVVARYPDINFREGSIEQLPFADAEFDTVVSTHTLEHVRNVGAAIAELRRVAKRRVIVVVPKERPYRYTFNLHLQFFPYAHSLRAALGPPAWTNATCETIEGQLYYCEHVDRAV